MNSPEASNHFSSRTWKVGALAGLTGLTVRALHHYDHLGLLTPSRRSAAGHRLYTADDVARLYRIALLRRLGFPLEQIARVLDDPEWQLREAVRHHLDHMTRRLDVALSLRSRLSGMATELSRSDSLSPDELFATLEEMTMLDSSVHSTTSLLVYENLADAHAYLVRVFGLTAGPLQRNDEGRVVHAEVRAGDQVIWLHPAAEGHRSPRQLGAVTGMTVIAVRTPTPTTPVASPPALRSSKHLSTRGTECGSTAPATSKASCGSSTRPSTDGPTGPATRTIVDDDGQRQSNRGIFGCAFP